MNTKLIISKIRKFGLKLLSGLLFYGVLLLLMLLIVFQLSFIQTFIAKEVLELLSQKTNHEISLNKVKVAWLDKGELLDVLVKDIHDDTLFYSNRVTINYGLLDLFSGDYLSFEEILVESAELNFIRHEPGGKLNIEYFIQSLKGDSSKSAVGKSIKVEHIEVVHFDFRTDDKPKPDLMDRIDFLNLDFSIQDLNLFDFELSADTIIGDLKHFTGSDRISDFSIEEFVTRFRISNQSLVLDNLDFRTETSIIGDSLEFFYNGFDDFSHFIDSVSFSLHFDRSVISQQDLRLVTGLDQVKSGISMDGMFWGTIGDFNIEDSRIGFGAETYLQGGVSCFGLPNLKKTFILADITNSRLDPSDLVPYIGDLSENLKRMGRIDFTGSFAGFTSDFIAKGDFLTDNGSVHSDIHIEIPSDPIFMSYEGNLALNNLNIGAFFENDVIQNVNLKTEIRGKGISLSTANFTVDTEIFESKLKGYQYDSIKINGSFSKNFFSGQILIEDPNCRLRGEAEVDFRNEKQKLYSNLEVDSLFLDRLNLSTDTLFTMGNIDIEVEDFDFDKFQASLKLDSSLLKYKDKTIVLDSVRFSSSYNEQGVREIDFAMPGLVAQVGGVFNVTDFAKDIVVMTDGYLNKLQLKSDTLQKIGSGEKYKFEVYLEIDDISPYLDSLSVPLKIYNQSTFEGTYRQGKASNFSLFFIADSLDFGSATFHYPIVEVNGAFNNSTKGVLTNFIVESSKQRIEGIPETDELLLEGVWFKNQIELSTAIKQPSSKTDLRLEAGIVLSKDSMVLHVQPSKITILDDQWKFNPSNQVVIRGQDMEIRNFEIFDSSESIYLEGYLSDTAGTSISISVEDLKMDKSNLFTETVLDGYLNGDFEIFREHSQDLYRFDGGFFLKDLKYDSVLIGDLDGNSTWDPIDGSVYSEVSVTRENFKSIDINGYYYPSKSQDQLSFLVQFNDAQLATAQPFLKGNFSEIKGTADGEIEITGALKEPKTDGTISIKNGGGRINYLNTVYTINGDVNLSTNRIDLNDLLILDRKGNEAIASGNVTYTDFSKFTLDLSLAANNFEFLNTTYIDNERYYGSAYGSSNEISITGPFNDLLIKAAIKTDPGTRFFIPISKTTDGSQKEFIEFVSFTDSTFKKEVQDEFQLKGLTLDFDLEITPDAYCELIFDIKKGDIIRGRGRGNLKLTLNTDGEFSMFGALEITEGTYNFTFSNLINKEFEVIPGGRIIWYGDPYNASLDMEATYLQRASLEELKNPEERSESLLSRRIPFLAVIKLPGTILNPEPEFDIRPQDQSDLQQFDNGALEQLTTEEELNKQFVSLLFLKKFTPTSSFLSGGGANLVGSVSEILSNQVSYLFSQIDENLEVELDLADLDQEAFNTFQLRLAYTFLDGRLKVTSGGNFGNGNANEESSVNEIVGDWSVEYSLTRDGRLRVKAFRNTNQLLTADQQSFERGVSLKLVDSFDRFKDILRIRRDAAIRRREEERAVMDNESDILEEKLK